MDISKCLQQQELLKGKDFIDPVPLKVDENVKLIKEKFKHPLKTYEEQWNSMPEKNKKILP